MSIESKKCETLAEKNKAFYIAWRNRDEESKEKYNDKAKIEEAKKSVYSTVKT